MKKLSLLLLLIAPLLLHAQSVGISNDNSIPHSSAILDIKSTTKGLLIPRMSTLERTSIMGPSIGLTVFDMDTYSYWMYRGDVMGGWVELQYSFQNHWSSNGINIYNSNAGNVGIGTSNPGEKLSINATNPTIQLMNAGTPRAFFQVSGTDMRMSTYFNNTTGNLVLGTRASDRLWINPSGNIGIGTSTPSSLLTINGNDPTLLMRDLDVDKGFLQVVGNDFKIGTSPTNTTGRFMIRTNGADRLNVNEDGWVGINTTIQNATLQVNGDGSNATFRAQVNGTTKLLLTPNGGVSIGANNFTPPPNGLHVAGMTSIGTTNAAAELSINNLPGNTHPHIDIYKDNAKIGHLGTVQNAQVDVNLAATSAAGRVILSTAGTPVGVMVHTNADAVSIGTFSKATGYQLSVGGNIMCWDLSMAGPNSWPDYVFEKNYRLMPLTEVRKFTNTYKHLPNVPSAAEIEKNGIKMGDMTKTFLEKIEELTLYIFQLQEQIDQLKKK
jgi:hypothetical protein